MRCFIVEILLFDPQALTRNQLITWLNWL